MTDRYRDLERALLVVLLALVALVASHRTRLVEQSAELVAHLIPPALAQAGCAGGTCTVTLANCTTAGIQAQVDLAIDGNVVQLPSGLCTLAGGPVNIAGKHITIQGTGPSTTHVVSTNTSNPGMFYFYLYGPGATNGGVAKLAHMWIDEGGPIGTVGQVILFSGASDGAVMQNIRYDYNRTSGPGNPYGGQSIRVQGNVNGVLQFQTMNVIAFGAPIDIKHSTWNNLGQYGDQSWNSPSTLGTNKALYIESSTFVCPAGSVSNQVYCNITDSDSGARVVWRGNNFVNGASLTMHGPDTPGRSARATRQWEYYFNRFADHYTYAAPYGIRSGTGYAFDTIATNLATGPSGTLQLNYQPGVGYDSHDPYPWGDCRVRPIATISCSGTTATITGTAFDLSYSEGLWAEIVGNSNGAYNGTWPVLTPSRGIYWHWMNSLTVRVTSCSGGGTGGVIRNPAHGRSTTTPHAADYPCADGIARGPGVLVSGDYANSTPPQAPNTSLLEALEPVGTWNVLYIGTGLIGWNDASGGTIANNRDHFNQLGASCASGGACTSGIGRGTTLPTTCSSALGGVTGANVMFWDTDDPAGNWNQEDAATHALHDPTSATHAQGQDGRLYWCSSPNTWTVHYTPYAYPHPLLVGGTPPAGNTPPTLNITAPSVSAYATTSATVTFGGLCVDDVACTGVTYTCTPACGSGSATGPPATWALSGASVPLGTSVWAFTPADAMTTGTPVSITVLRRAVVASLPYTDAHDASAVFPTLGPHYTLYGPAATQFGLTATGQGIVNAAGFGAAAFTGFAVNADQYMDVEIVDIAPLARQLRICFRTTGTAGQTSDLNTYFVQWDGSNSATNLIGRYDGGAFAHNYTPSGLGAVNLPVGTKVGGQMIGTTIQARVDGVPFGPVIQTAGEYVTGTVANCSVGVNTRWDNTVIGNSTAPVDTTPPTVAIDMPSSSAAVYQITPAQSPITVEAAVADNVGIWSCNWTNSATPGTNAVTPVAGRISASVAITNGVTNTVTMTCQDAVGNTTSDAIPIVIIIEPPPVQNGPVNLRGIFR